MNVVELDGLGKYYWQLEEQAMLLKSLLPFTRPKRHALWALRGVDLQLEAGGALGVLGRNGAGKTTLLRLLAGVTRPSEGTVTLRGRIAPLISVGVGFHAEMSGRENVFVNGMLLGLTRAEVEERFDDIVGFAELADFIDTPVKFYSSGMFMRLGFSVAVHTQPDLLLIDEILAVGDAAFRLKCYTRLKQLHEAGAAVVLVSHSVDAIRLMAPRALVLGRGHVVFDGPIEEAIAAYHHELGSHSDDPELPLHERRDRGAVLVQREVLEDGGAPTTTGHQDRPLTYRAELHFKEDVATTRLYFLVRDELGTPVYVASSTPGEPESGHRAGDTATVEIPFTPRFGGGGSYAIELLVADGDNRDLLGLSPHRTPLYVAPRLGVHGVTDLEARILVDGHAVDHHPPLTLGATPPEPDPLPPMTDQ